MPHDGLERFCSRSCPVSTAHPCWYPLILLLSLPKEGRCFCSGLSACLSLCVQKSKKRSCERILMNLFGRLGCSPGNGRLDLGYPDHGLDPGIFKRYLLLR